MMLLVYPQQVKTRDAFMGFAVSPPRCSLSVSSVSVMRLRAKPSSAEKIWVVLTGLSLFLCQINYKHWVICCSIPCCSCMSTWKAHGMTIRCLLSSFSPLLVLALFISRYTRAHLEGTECITLNNEHWFVVLSWVHLDFLLCKHNYCQPSLALSFSGLNTQIVPTMWLSALFLGDCFEGETWEEERSHSIPPLCNLTL